MPEGPSLRRWCKVAQQFTGQVITKITGPSTAIDKAPWEGATFATVQVYGKQMFLQLKRMQSHDSVQTDHLWLRYHFLMWGSLHANQYKSPSKRSKTKQVPNPRIVLHFQNKQFLAFYGGSLKHVDGPCEDTGIDILSDTFNKEKAASAILQDMPVCYSLMDQNKFAGLGNIIKNEVLYRTKTHPLELGSTLTKTRAKMVAEQVVTFTKSWMDWEDNPNGKKFNEQMMIYWKWKCPLGHATKRGWFGDQLKRMTIWCPECQPLTKESEIYHLEIVNTKKVKRPRSKTITEDDSLVVKKKTVKRKVAMVTEEPKKKTKRAKRSDSDPKTFEDEFDESNVFKEDISSFRTRKRPSSKVVDKKKATSKTKISRLDMGADGDTRKCKRKSSSLSQKSSKKESGTGQAHGQSDKRNEVNTGKTQTSALCQISRMKNKKRQLSVNISKSSMSVKKGTRQSVRLAAKDS